MFKHEEGEERPTVFEHEDFREFMKLQIDYLKRTMRSFSLRSLSKRAGFSSPAYIRRVTSGERNLTEDSIPKVAKALKLNNTESRFFRLLCLYNQSTSLEEKAKLFDKITRDRRYQKFFPLRKEQFDYYKQWYIPAICEAIELKDFNEDPNYLAKKMIPEIEPKQAEEAIDTLIKLGLVERNEYGKLVRTRNQVKTDDVVASLSVAKFHSVMSDKAKESLELFDVDQRETNSVTFSISSEHITQIRNHVREFQRRLIDFLTAIEGQGNQIYQLNLHLFPLTDEFDQKK